MKSSKDDPELFSLYKDDVGEILYSRTKQITPGKDYFMSVKKTNAINKLCEIFEALEGIQNKVHKKEMLNNLEFPALEEKLQDLEIAIRDYEAYNRDND
jgi:hypothetical protein